MNLKMSELLSDSLQTAVATQKEYQLPSIFEVFAQENLKCSVRPAFEHLVKVRIDWESYVKALASHLLPV